MDKYTWVDLGSSYLPSDILAAYLFAQLEAGDHILAQRKRVSEYYVEHLQDWAQANDVRLPIVRPIVSNPITVLYASTFVGEATEFDCIPEE